MIRRSQTQGVKEMGARKSEKGRDKDINRRFERQQRRLNRKWMKHAVSGFVVLTIIVIALQFTPYRDVPMDLVSAAKNLVVKLTSGTSAPAEPDPQYW